MQLKEYLGMAKIAEDGTVEEEQYPKFSQFKKQVLDAVQEDFAKLSKEDKIDIMFTDCTPIYKGDKQEVILKLWCLKSKEQLWEKPISMARYWIGKDFLKLAEPKNLL